MNDAEREAVLAIRTKSDERLRNNNRSVDGIHSYQHYLFALRDQS